MSGILAIIVPILNAGASGSGPPPDGAVFDDDEAVVAFSSLQDFNLTKAPQEF